MTDKGKLKLPDCFIADLCVPGQPTRLLQRRGDALVTVDDRPEMTFPIVRGTPILINEDNSVFLLSHYREGKVTTMDLRDPTEKDRGVLARLKAQVGRMIPGKSRNVSKYSGRDALADLLDKQPDAKILVVGAGEARFEIQRDANIVYTDVALAPDTHLIADAHDIPFVGGVFDAVFAIAVLEHVADPNRCVEEIRRVLKPEGLVFSSIPFMQQVHMGRYDYTRFTAIGHRRLFRWFDEVRSGVSNGPGMALAWSLEYFLSSFSEKPVTRHLLQLLSRCISWPFLLADEFLAGKAGAYDCASAYYFCGRLRDAPLSERQIIAQYRGMGGLS
ncbi:MAG: class I SAM-dependent methyltransferase [Alphaproteobacteria bacterium]